MKPIFLLTCWVVPATLALAPAVAQLQTVQPLSPTADALAAEMRILGSEPNNVGALLSAGELALKLGDATAAARFFARAERIDPRSGRLKAGEASALVHLERPGEALRMFAEAQALGADPASFAAEQGLAYDLIGQQARAQRAYRVALRTAPNDDTVRRLALSLGISGDREAALAQIDGQVRRSDRAGWRVRAFILAMTGDVEGAQQIAIGMLPGTMAAGLKPFFEQLATLGPVDRAFAVHFGELGPTPQRVADARLAPVLPPLAPDPAPVLLADAAQPKPVVRDRRGRRPERAAQPAIVEATRPAIAPLPAPPREVIAAVDAADAPDDLPQGPAPPVPTRRVATAQAPDAAGLRDRATRATGVGQVTTPKRPILVVDEKPPVRVSVPRADPAPGTGAADPVLAKIIAGIGVPAGELGVASTSPASRTPPPVPSSPAKPTDDEAAMAAEKRAAEKVASDRTAAAKLAADKEAAAKLAADKLAAEKLAAAKKLADKKAAADKIAADKKAAEKKAADKAAADRKAAEDKAAKADPSRIWVQVAGGASVSDLPKAWAGVRAKAPALLKGKAAWTTPLRFTNRLLTGPFASTTEAQSFVNALAGQGVSGFVFTSTRGQVIAKVPTK